MRLPPGPPDPQQALLRALGHPMRKMLLKLCLEAGENRSPRELALATYKGKRPFLAHLSNVSYHVRVLAEYGAVELVETRPVRGAVEHLYRAASLIEDVPWGRAALGLEDRA